MTRGEIGGEDFIAPEETVEEYKSFLLKEIEKHKGKTKIEIFDALVELLKTK